MQMVVAGGAGKDTTISGRPVFFLGLGIHVAQNHTALRPWKGFMRAACHPRRALAQRRLELTTCYESQNVRTIIEQRNILCLAEGGYLRHWFRKKKETLAHDDQLGRYLVNQCNCFLSINMVVVFSQRQIMQVHRIWAAQLQRLAPILNTPPKHSYRPMTDMPASIG